MFGCVLPLLSFAKAGGETSVSNFTHQAFSQPAANMPLVEKLNFHVGNSFFRNPWVIAPASTDARDGLGPLFNTNACQNCHIRDGRGHPPLSDDDNAVSMIVRLSVPATESNNQQTLLIDGAIPDPIYGHQLQDFAIPGIPPEARITIDYKTITKVFSDGHKVTLRSPTVKLSQLAYGQLHNDAKLSTRIAPPMIGLGLLQAIDGATLESLSDPTDNNRDGISGRVNRVWNQQTQTTDIGRFGWKASQPTLKQQNAAAFNGDLGITSSIFPNNNCTTTQKQCIEKEKPLEPEVSDNILDAVTFYSHNLAVPIRRNTKAADVIKGQQLFKEAKCNTCHIERITTGTSQFPWLSQQTIEPYTDLLLHDMGDGLADNRSDFLASGSEWRTPPLWGIGLTKTVAGQMHFLHDGRARTLLEAVLWHGGEAQQSTDEVLQFNADQRHALIAFLQSL